MNARGRVAAAVLAIVVAPVAAVWFVGMEEAVSREQLKLSVAKATAQEPGEAWVRVIGPQGVRAEQGRPVHGPWMQLGDLFFDNAPSVLTWDADAGALASRDIVERARVGEAQVRCRDVMDERLTLCEGAARQGDAVHYSVAAQRRVVRALHSQRLAVAKLMGMVSLWSLAVGLFLTLSITRPLEALRREAVKRAEGPLDVAPLDSGRNDEFGELADAFDTLLQRLRERNARNEAFTADLVHELKSPIAAIASAAEALEGEPSSTRVTRVRSILEASATRLDALTQEVLALARAEGGSPEPRMTLELAPLVHALVGDRATITGGSFEVTLRPEAFGTVMRNLLDNAEAHGGSIVVEMRADLNALDVVDDGPGIPADLGQRVFERFVTGRPGGTGLGLPLCRALVEADGGTLSLEPSTQGTRMRIRWT